MESFRLTLAISTSARGNPRLARLRASLRAQHTPWPVETLMGHPDDQDPSDLARVRNELYRRAQGEYVLFLDEDVELPDAWFLVRIERHLRLHGGFVGGFYLGGEGPWQRAYNLLANFWLDLHHHRGDGVPVAGAFALRRLELAPDELDFPFSRAAAFGGEEILLARAARARKLRFHLDQALSVRHDGRRSAKVFYRRAWQHGEGPNQPVPAGEALAHLWRRFLKPAGWSLRWRVLSYLALVVAVRSFVKGGRGGSS